MKTAACGLTLVELLIALVLTAMVIVGFVSIDFFGRYQMLTADRRSKVQNEAGRVLDHMSKGVMRAIGNESVYGANTVARIDVTASSRQISFYIDGDGDGRRDTPINNPPLNTDRWISYRWDSNGAPGNQNQIRYCDRCQDQNGNCNFNQCMAPGVEILTQNVSPDDVNTFAFSCSANKDAGNVLLTNYVQLAVTTRYSVDDPVSFENPEVSMLIRADMPSVSLR